jgi:hypothetical protein
LFREPQGQSKIEACCGVNVIVIPNTTAEAGMIDWSLLFKEGLSDYVTWNDRKISGLL